jgi:hypothetical protein
MLSVVTGFDGRSSRVYKVVLRAFGNITKVAGPRSRSTYTGASGVIPMASMMCFLTIHTSSHASLELLPLHCLMSGVSRSFSVVISAS